MFNRVRQLIDVTVDKTGQLAKQTVEIATGVTTLVVAESLHRATGRAGVGEKLWDIQGRVAGKLSGLVDQTAPVAKAVVKAPVRNAERLYELGQGVGQVLFSEQKEEGYRKVEEALTEIAAVVITGGIAGALLEYTDGLSGAPDAPIDSAPPDVPGRLPKSS